MVGGCCGDPLRQVWIASNQHDGRIWASVGQDLV
jgi:hypothetical protein